MFGEICQSHDTNKHAFDITIIGADIIGRLNDKIKTVCCKSKEAFNSRRYTCKNVHRHTKMHTHTHVHHSIPFSFFVYLLSLLENIEQPERKLGLTAPVREKFMRINILTRPKVGKSSCQPLEKRPNLCQFNFPCLFSNTYSMCLQNADVQEIPTVFSPSLKANRFASRRAANAANKHIEMRSQIASIHHIGNGWAM